MEPLSRAHLNPIVYGSIARGDVSATSDIDIFFPNPISSTIIEATLDRAGIIVNRREIIQATPNYAAKAYLYLDEKKGYSFPLVELRPNEAEFYSFAGSLDFPQLRHNERKMGVDKRLMLIEPTEGGHTESMVHGFEGVVAGKLDVGLRIVRERVRTLERRGRVGRTGVYLKRELAPDENISTVFNEISRNSPAIRRRLRLKK